MGRHICVAVLPTMVIAITLVVTVFTHMGQPARFLWSFAAIVIGALADTAYLRWKWRKRFGRRKRRRT